MPGRGVALNVTAVLNRTKNDNYYLTGVRSFGEDETGPGGYDQARPWE